MARFRLVLLILILWLIFVFNLERPDVFGEDEGIDLSSLTYVLAAMATLGILMLPELSEIHFMKVFGPLIVLYVVAKLAIGYSSEPSIFVYITASEVVVLFVTVFLARVTSHTYLNMEVALEDVVLEKENSRVLTMNDGEEQISIELFRARRYGYTVSIIHLGVSWLKEMQLNSSERFDVQNLLKRRYVQGQVAKNTEAVLYRGDIAAWHNDNLVVCLPGSDLEAAQKIAREIHSHLKIRLGIDIRVGISVFPNDGLIYEDLLDAALRDVRHFSYTYEQGGTVYPPFIDGDGHNEPGFDAEVTRPTAGFNEQPPFIEIVLRELRGLVSRPVVLPEGLEDVFPSPPSLVDDPASWVDALPMQSGSSRAIYLEIKRLIDILVVLAVSPVLFPLLGLAALLVYLDSGRPIFFMQERTGLGGHRFKMYKFRTMVPDAEEQLKELAAQGLAKLDSSGKLAEPLKLQRDPRITRMGRILRKTSLDELPQLINVLRGDMSIVGPRPTSWDLESYNLFQTERLSVRPGITGLWQVYSRGTTDFNIWLHWDVKYIDKMSLYLDTRLIIETFLRILVRRTGAR